MIRERSFPCPRCGLEEQFVVEVRQTSRGLPETFDYPAEGPEYEAEMQLYKGRLRPCDGPPEAEGPPPLQPNLTGDGAEACRYVPTPAEQDSMMQEALAWAWDNPREFDDDD